MEPITRMLPKKAYSIIDAVKYISLNYNIDISENDLLEYIQSGDLVASVYIAEGMGKIYSLNRKSLPDNKKIEIYEEDIYLQFSKTESNARIIHLKEFEFFRIDINHSYFDLTIVLDEQFYDDNYFEENEKITIYGSESGKLQSIAFNGYFNLGKWVFEGYNISELTKTRVIEQFPDININLDEWFSFFVPVHDNKTKLHLDDVCILHKDIVDFLEFFSVVDSNSHQDELHKLKNDIDNKNKLIEELQKQIEKNNKVKKSTASENKKNEFIKALLQIKYGAAVAENPRPHVYDPNDSEKGKDGVIQRDFELKGLTKHLPSGKTLKNWVSSVELDN